MLVTKEHYDLMIQFEREHRGRMDKEPKESWPRGVIYQDGHVNELFLAYRRGYAFAVADYRSDLQNLEASRDGYRRDAERLQAELDRLNAAQQDAPTDAVYARLHEIAYRDSAKAVTVRADDLRALLARYAPAQDAGK